MPMPPGGASPDPIDIAVGARIRARRCALGMGRETLAALIGLSSQTVSKFESGAAAISPGRLVKIARALAVDVVYFFGAEAWAPSEPAPPAEPVAAE